MNNTYWFKCGIFALSALMFVGCATKLADNESEKTLDYGMANSKKIEIKNSATSKTFVMVTYLNPIKNELIDQESEKFVVGTYKATGDGAFERVSFNGYKVNGNDENVTVTPLEFGAPLLKLVSTANAWSNYVLVQAPKTEKINMELSFENDRSEKVSVNFRKDF